MLACAILLTACGGGSGGPGFFFLPTSAPAAGTPAGIDPPPPMPDTPPQPGEEPAAQDPGTGTGLPPLTGSQPTPPVVVAPPGTPVLCSERVDKALASGDPSGLIASDAGVIAACAHSLVIKQREKAGFQALTASIYKGVDSAYEASSNTQLIIPLNLHHTTTLVAGDAGRPLAAISMAAGGRAAAYNMNALEQFHEKHNMAHVPAFKRLLSWLVTGNADAALPATPLKIGWMGLDQSDAQAGLREAVTSNVTNVDCRNSIKTPACAQGLQLMIVGADMPSDPELESGIREMMASGTAVLFFQKGRFPNLGGRQVMAGLDLTFGDYYGNYWSPDSVKPGRSEAVNQQKLDRIEAMLPLLEKMARNSWRTDYAWGNCDNRSCPPLLDDVLRPADQIGTLIDAYSLGGRNLFGTANTDVERLLALWADVARGQIRYPLDKTKQSAQFQQAMVADRWIAYVRPQGKAQADLKSFLGPDAQKVAPSSTDEVISVRLSQESGFTAMGRFALPGQTVSIEVLDAAGAGNLRVKVNTLRPGTTDPWGNEYDRPRFLTSLAMPVPAGSAMQFSSPYGGPLQLVYDGAASGATVKLRIRGVASHPFLDLTRNGDLTTFMAALQTSTLDWAEIKLGNVEIHTRIDKMTESLNAEPYKGNLTTYLEELRTIFFEDIYLLAGFSLENKSLSNAVQDWCTRLGWDCVDKSIHRAPGVQHINADAYAACGAGCSGNPYDQTWGLHPRGWGESHEVGHNLQQGMLNVYGEASIEVSNNMFPLHKNWSVFQFDRAGAGTQNAISFREAYDQLIKARQSGKPAKSEAYRIIWGELDDVYANNGARLAFYMQWVLYWEDRMGDRQRGWDLFTMLYLHQRLFHQGDWAAQKDRLGYSQYASRPGVNGNDNLLITLSFLTQRDQRPTFDLWGIDYSPEAAAQVQAHGLAPEPAFLYVNNQMTDHSTARRLDMTQPNPAWPF